MLPAKVSKVDTWKQWKVDVEDYAEASMAGLKRALREVKSVPKHDEPAEFNDFWFEGRGCPQGSPK